MLASAVRYLRGLEREDTHPMPGPARQQIPPHPARLTVGVIGAGRVGTVLGAALARAGHRVVAASAVSDASVARARRLLPDAAIKPPDEVLAASGLVLLTVPDDALPGLVAGLAATGAPMEGRLLAHASGRHGTGVLEPATRLGALPLALHPVMTFTGRPDDLDRLAGICFGVTAPDPLRPVAEALVIEMGGEPVFIDEANRALYHAALASGANHLITLVVQAADLLRAAGVPDPARMLTPLLSAALDNALRLGDAGLTGPTRTRSRITSRHCAMPPRRRCVPMSRWPGSPPTARWRPGCSPPLMRSGCSTCSRVRRGDPHARPDQGRPGRRPPRTGCPGRAGSDHGGTTRGTPGPAPPRTGPFRAKRKRGGICLRQPAPVRRW